MKPRTPEPTLGPTLEPTLELIPAIDLKEGRCVRLFQGDFAAETVYSNAPAAVLERYSALGARHVHVVDLDGARDGTQPNRQIVFDLARPPATRPPVGWAESSKPNTTNNTHPPVKLQVGGGLRTLERVRELLDAGIERAVIGSVAVTAPEEVMSWMTEVDPSRIVLAFDVRIEKSGAPMLTTHGWRQTSGIQLWDAVERFAKLGLRHVLCTDVARDGALTGPNCELYAQAVRRFPELRWQASGGVATAADLAALDECGLAAVISGKAMLENRIPIEELRPFLPNASFPAST